MSNYTRQDDFSVKDGLSSGDPNKIIVGADLDTEFDAIATAVETKADLASGHTTGNLASLDANGNPQDSGQSVSTLQALLSIPSGAILPYAGSSAPSGFLICDGSEVSRTIYANLFAVCSTIYGSGDGSTTFNLPDLRGEFLRGFDDGTRGVDPDTRSLGDNQSHAVAEHVHNYRITTGLNTAGVGNRTNGNASLEDTASTHMTTGPFAPGGTSYVGAEETRPRNVAVNFVIKT